MKINNATPMMTNVIPQANKKQNNVAFQGNLTNSFKDMFQLERAGNMSRKLFTLNAFAFLLGGRLLKSRDKNEIRETATRDIPTILIAVFGVPEIEKIVAKSIHNSKGFAVCQPNSKGKMDPASYSQLNDWYKFDDKLESGFKGFTDRLNERGGNLKKIFSTVSGLSEDSKAHLVSLSDKNDDLIKALFEVDDVKTAKSVKDLKDVKNKALLKDLEKAFSCGKNEALSKAKWLKTVPILVGFGLTLGLIGIMIPRMNIAITESINKKKKIEPASGDTLTLAKAESAKEEIKTA